MRADLAGLERGDGAAAEGLELTARGRDEGARPAPAPKAASGPWLPLYACTLVLSAALLFLAQPMFARPMLPLVGGSPSAWNTAMVFYQLVLLGGYAYAHFATRGLGLVAQARLHLAVLVLPAMVLPFGIPADFRPPAEGSPAWALLGMMATTIGPPFFVVSATAPMLQRWFGATGHAAGRDPYFLYAAGNAGSMLGLLGYPLVVEPMLAAREQAVLWAAGYALLAVLIAACSIGVRAPDADSEAAARARRHADPKERGEHESRGVTWTRRLRWTALAFAPSSLMISATTYLSNEIAPIPLLWVAPLALYLGTFVLAFARRPVIPHAALLRALPIVFTGLVVAICAQATGPLLLLVVVHLTGLFVAGCACHGELSRDRPGTDRLTDFYLCISLGGVLGGAFNAFVAPALFTSIGEYPIGIVLAAALMPRRDGGGGPAVRWTDAAAAGAVLVMTLGLVTGLRRAGLGEAAPLLLPVVFGAPYVVAYLLSPRPLSYALCVAALFAGARAHHGEAGSALFERRTFFGVHRVTEPAGTGLRYLMHGSTVHGVQNLDARLAPEPVAYYARSGPLGDVFRAAALRPEDAVGAIGLGTGAISAYALEGQRFTIYEIDPVVRDIAGDPGLFTFLSRSHGAVRVVIGDGRLGLARAADAEYALLAVDAYSSESPPLHLMTREALALYRRKTRPDGVVALHISNRHMSLEPVFARLAQDAGLPCLLGQQDAIDPEAAAPGTFPSIWAVLTTNREVRDRLLRMSSWRECAPKDTVTVWTDDHASLVRLLF